MSGKRAGRAQLCNSRELAAHRQVFDKYLRYQMLFLTFRGTISGEEHWLLMEAALARDSGAAQTVLTRQISAGISPAVLAQPDGPESATRSGRQLDLVGN